MIKHVVLWQLKEFASEAEKQNKITEIKEALETLPSKITEIKSLEVGINVNDAEKYDLVLITQFANLEELEAYAKHPDHIAVGGVLKPFVANRACVDCEL